MIAPRSALLIVAALVMLPGLTLLIAVPSLAAVAVLVLLLFLLVIMFDAWFMQPALSSIRISLPEVIRLSKGRDGSIEVRLTNERSDQFQFRIGFPFSPEVGATENNFDIVLPPASTQVLTISCRPKERGRFLLSKCYLQKPSRLRFWNLRQVIALKSELRVYPDLITGRRKVAAIFLPHGRFGFRQHRQLGKGREFEKLREYIPGDGVEDIHWKATAKRGRPVTKVYQIERTQEVYVIIDSSRLSARMLGDMSILERFITAGLILCLAAAKQSDLFGLVTFSDKTHRFIRAKNGKTHYDACRDALYTLQPESVTPDFQDLFASLRLRLRRRALLIFLTSLDDPVLGNSFLEHLNLLTRQHLVLVSMIQPKEARPLFAGERPTEVDAIYSRLGGHLLWGDMQEIRKRLQRLGVEFSMVQSDQLAAETVSRYFKVKQRQLL